MIPLKFNIQNDDEFIICDALLQIKLLKEYNVVKISSNIKIYHATKKILCIDFSV